MNDELCGFFLMGAVGVGRGPGSVVAFLTDALMQRRGCSTRQTPQPQQTDGQSTPSSLLTVAMGE